MYDAGSMLEIGMEIQHDGKVHFTKPEILQIPTKNIYFQCILQRMFQRINLKAWNGDFYIDSGYN